MLRRRLPIGKSRAFQSFSSLTGERWPVSTHPLWSEPAVAEPVPVAAVATVRTWLAVVSATTTRFVRDAAVWFCVAGASSRVSFVDAPGVTIAIGWFEMMPTGPG